MSVLRVPGRSDGRSLEQVIDTLKAFIPGWKGYFQLAQTPSVFRRLDERNAIHAAVSQ